MNRAKMRCMVLAAVSAASLVWAVPSFAQSLEEQDHDEGPRGAAGTEIWASTDSEGTNVVKVSGRALWDFQGKDDYAGIVVEHAWFTPAVGETRQFDRVYLDMADRLNDKWRWRARLGTDGDTVLGSAELRRADWSRSFFFGREIVETAQGLNRRIYYTFLGASTDIPIDENNTLAVTAAVQEFSGENERLHLRGRYVHVLKASAGLSAQMDLRYYHSTKPGEFDYFSPANFVRAVPILQWRKFDDNGWMYLAAAGFGAQRSTGSDWMPARLVQLRFESPRSSDRLDAFGELVYTNDSITGGPSYDYLQGRLGLTIGF